MSSDIAIKVEQLSKCFHIYDKPHDRLLQMFARGKRQYYREFWALRDVSFEVGKGETVGIIGHNGSGKSTLLQMICGTLNPTSGTVRARGRIAALLELGAGFNPEFTGRENVYLNATILGLTKDEIDERFDAIAAFADIGAFMAQPVKSYSSGMYVRLAFAVQSMIDPDIFIVDEALAVGDEKFQRKCFARLEDLKSKGTSILFVSHSPSSIIELCDRTLLLDHGVRLKFGGANDTVRAYQKLIYAPDEERKRLVELYQTMDRFGEGAADQVTRSEIADESVGVSSSDHDRAEEVIDDYDPSLVPETTTSYPAQGAKIEEFQIIDPNGRQVNILQPGGEYQIIMRGRFLDNFDGLFFAVHIRTISGVVVTGQRYPEEQTFFKNAVAGNAFKVRFSMKMDLLPGTYFVGGGIWSNAEPACPHRVLDALMFRLEKKGRDTSFGYVDLRVSDPVLELFENQSVN